ncbi:MAG: SprT-like domain-containing protein [Nocardioides sp.]|nr:SprT-like domain-containing protein [Nocardioides sp.]
MDLRDACALAEHLLEVHGLRGWTVEYDAAKSRAGVCRYTARVLGLSAPLTSLHDEAEVRDTILHEIAHALAGPAHGHDAQWRRIATRIGSSGHRCVSADAPRVQHAWLGVCPAGHTTGRHRRPERVATCAQCSRAFDLAHLLSWTHHGRPAPMHPNYEAELARVRSGDGLRLIPIGARARVTVAGDHHGREGRVLRRGRTSYHLHTRAGVIRVPFAFVEAV